jgi:AcrR family transcriptional regulator
MRPRKISKTQIINAAARAIVKFGLENVTVEDIAKEAGIAKGSIYQYFKNRDAILIAGISYSANQRISALRELLARFKTATSKMKALLKASKQMARTDPDMFLMNYALLLSTHKNIKREGASAFFKAYIDLVEDIIKKGIENKEFRKGDARVMALAVILTQDFGTIFDLLEPKVVDRRGLQKNILDILKP